MPGRGRLPCFIVTMCVCVLCLPDEGLSGAGAAAEGRGDRAASGGAADAGDGAGSFVAGGGEAGGHPAAPATAQGPGQSHLNDTIESDLVNSDFGVKATDSQDMLFFTISTAPNILFRFVVVAP